MAWGDPKFDCYYRLPGDLVVCDYLLKNHGKEVPPNRGSSPQGITIASVPVLMKNDDSAEYVKNLNLDGFVPHVFDCLRGTWKILDFESCWQRYDGTLNKKTICIAMVVSSGTMPFFTPDGELVSLERSYVPFHNTARLVAYLLHKYHLPVTSVKVTKECSDFITSRWSDFKREIRKQLNKL